MLFGRVLWTTFLWVCCGLLVGAGVGGAVETETALSRKGGSEQVLILVDKAKQRLVLREGATQRAFVCTTGQRTGDKERRGDLKTPEGVYFVLERRTKGLDNDEYGGEAFVLDYPNPVDRLRGKTGSGIWLHGRGHTIEPRESRGCVVLNKKDLRAIRAKVKPGTPVLVGAAEPVFPVGEEALRRIEQRTRDWCRACQTGAPLAGFYAATAFPQKEKELEPRGPVRVLEGPGYWVSWFAFSTPEGSGLRRLYWQRQGDAFVIVGETEQPL